MFKKITLKNGLRIITYPMENTKALTLLVLVGTGSKYETKEINGISHLLEHMAFKGTKNRPKALDISRELDGVGGIYNAFTGQEYTGFWIKVDSKHFDLASDVLSDMVFNSLFREEEIEKEKKTVIEEINMYQDTPQSYVLDLWEKILYGDQPAGWSIVGDKETVQKISREDVLNYFQSQFVAKNALICLAGNFENETALAKIENFFGSFNDKEYLPKKPVIESQRTPQVLLEEKKTDQTHLVLGVRAFDIFSPKKYALEVLANLLGGPGSMSSRLFIEVREKRGMAYYVRTLAENFTDAGYLITHAGVNSQRSEEAIGIILEEYKKIKTEEVPAAELRKAKDNLKGHLYLGLETSDSWASYAGMQEILTKKILTPEEECAMIDKVTADDVLAVAKEIFVPEKLNLALIGPFKDEAKFQQLLKF